MKPIRRVAVLGAGTMGSRIAGHLANAGIPSLLLDLTLPCVDVLLKAKPAVFYSPEAARLVEVGTFENDLPRIAECDWILEAVSENLGVKRALFDRVSEYRSAGSIVSTNTSGIPLANIVEGYPDEFCEHFLGTHFFNPPRYLHLAELIAGPQTRPEVLVFMAEFCDQHLGKGVVPCKDTPNFIANRIGAFFGATVQRLTVEHDLSIEEVDALTGPLIGCPKSASYRLLDIVGLDIWANALSNVTDAPPMQPFLTEMIARGWLGEKSGQGCYKRVGKDREIYAIDWKTLEYHPAARPDFGLKNRSLRELVESNMFVRELLTAHVAYAATMVPEISNRVVEIDRAMRWGYGHALGPFEISDALGLHAEPFYRAADVDGEPHTEYFDLANGGGYRELEPRPGIVRLQDLKRARGVVEKNEGASLIEMGEGVVCCEFHSKMNSVGVDGMAMLRRGLELLDSSFDAMVIGNQGQAFSAGASLKMILALAECGDWVELNRVIDQFQQLNMALKYACKPVVAAPFGLTLGGGCEISLHCARVQASAELYMGLVETGVGLIPGGGGCKEMLLRTPDVKKVFQQIGFAKVSASAVEARDMRYLRDRDGISMNPERLLDDARKLALSLVATYAPGAPRTDVTVGGEELFALLKMGVWMARRGGYISDHDAVIGEKLAFILSGGRLTGTPQVSEQYLLDLEREAFLSLCAMPQTQQRMAHILKTGKALRN